MFGFVGAARHVAVDVLVHRHEPLRGAAEDHLGLRAPRMRVGVRIVLRCREQRARFAQVRTDRPIGGVELRVDHRALPAEPAPVLAVLAVALDRELRRQAVGLAQLEIVLAVVGRHVDQPGAGVGGDELARQERPRLGEKSAEVVHRVTRDGAGEVGAFTRPLFEMASEAETRFRALQQRSSNQKLFV